MKTFPLLFVALLGGMASVHAQNGPGIGTIDTSYGGPQSPTHAGFATAPLGPEQLDQLLGPIALYPDALIALILPAATMPADIVLAARYLRQQGTDLSQVENRAWDDSVKSLVHYPEVVKWMDENLLWTKQLGEAFAEQPAEVMKSLQRLRARAQSTGALTNTPQQQVLIEQQAIRIVPSQPDVIYVPYYDPAIVYVERPAYYSYGRPALTFGSGCRVGSWLAYDFDWNRSNIWMGDRHRHWDGGHDWRRPIMIAPVAQHPGYSGYTSYRAPRAWQPPPRPPRPALVGVQPQAELPRTPPMRGVSPGYQPMGPSPANRTYDPQRPGAPVPPLNRVYGPVAGQPVPAPAPAPAPTVTPTNRGRGNDSGSRPPDSRGRTYQPPADRTYQPPANAGLTSTPPMQVIGSTSQSYPTVVAPPRERSYPGRAAAPIAVPPLQVQGPPQNRAPAPAPSVAPAPAPVAGTPAPAPPERGDRLGRDRRTID